MTTIVEIKGKSSTSEIIEALKTGFFALIDKGNKKFAKLNEVPKAIYSKEDAFRLIGEMHREEFERFVIEMTSICQDYDEHETVQIKLETAGAKNNAIYIEGFVWDTERSEQGMRIYERLLQRNIINFIATAKVTWYQHLWKLIQKAEKINKKSPIVKIIK